MATPNGKIHRLTEPATEPLTKNEAKRQLRIETTDTTDDTLLDAYIATARNLVEEYCNTAWASARWIFTFRQLAYKVTESGWEFKVPWQWVTSIESITYLDSDDAERSITSGNITLDTDFQHITIPANTDGHNFKVKFTAGPPTGQSGNEVLPPAIKQAMLLFLTDLYENRSNTVYGTIIAGNPAAELLMTLHRKQLGV